MNDHTYIWQDSDWPHLTWDESRLTILLAEVNTLRGQLLGRMSMFGFEEQSRYLLESLSDEIEYSAKIEGENLNRDSVRSSVARQLGLKYDGLPKSDHYVEGVVQVMLDATLRYREALNAERLFSWHCALFPTGRSGMYDITVGDWRKGDEPMQVVSGPLGHQHVHYEAPLSSNVPQMMDYFFGWVNGNEPFTDPLIKVAVAHLWFVTIHPFDDGNGRLCRTITEMLLSRADDTDKRYYSMSSEILKHRNEYYDHLEKAQKGSLNVTEWVLWFIHTLKNALNQSIDKTNNIVDKVMFWNKNQSVQLNDRQRKVINMLLDGFEGKLNSSKWYKINHCSQDTAIRDLNDLIAKGILRKTDEGGRSTNYELVR